MINIGTWNAMTLLKTGKMNEIVDEMSKNAIKGNSSTRIEMERSRVN
jgi:hypothetical protein